MKIIAHTPYGDFESKDIPESQYMKFVEELNNIHLSTNFSFTLIDDGVIFFTKEMISSTLFILEK